MICVNEKEMCEVLEIVNKLAANCDVYVFGSRGKGNAKQYSDLDLAFDAGENLDFLQYCVIKEAFEESDIPYRVDVIDYHAADEWFREIIDKKKELIFKGKKLKG